MMSNNTEKSHLSHSDFIETLWDVVIIGTGMGGATAGYALSTSGHRVLFLEKGLSNFPSADDTLQLGNEDPSARLLSGNWPNKITGGIDNIHTQFFPPLGCGAGGTTLLYAAAMERFDKSDFIQSSRPGEPPSVWPVTFEQFQPYYHKAEKLYKVRGTEDPLNPDKDSQLLAPPALTECDEHFLKTFQASGLHPYRLHVAYGYEPDCKECGGYICSRKCKGDARTICLEPALQTGNAHILDNCEVTRLEADASTVNEVMCIRNGEKFSIRARIVVLAAGAYFSPVLLLKSANKYWPKGLANTSDMVGRNLMFHACDHIAVWPRGKYSMKGPRKTLAFRDFYTYQGIRLGSVQSTGLTVGYGNIVYFLKSTFDQSRWRWFKPVRPLLRIPAYIASKLFGNASIFATIMEDHPYPENRVMLDPDEPSGMRFNYVIHAELRERINTFRRLVRNVLKRHRLMFVTPEINMNYGHPSGTCRFGHDPASNVLDENNRTHDLNNLYVVDASFMPTCAGANPSLTIAANALRVAEHISKNLRRENHSDPRKTGANDART